MGEVYRARDDRLGRDVAVKVLLAFYSADPDRLRRFEQEAHTAGMLNHPNILAIYDIGTHEGSPYLVTELLEGETLRERLGGEALSPRKAIDYALQIANGLAAAHDKLIVHRDLKPENLVLTRDGRVKILDFGLAKLTQPEAAPGSSAANAPTASPTEPGVVLGTMGYMSPEQVRGRPTDQRSDLFAFGAILYEMLSGQRAFRGESPVETMHAILKSEPSGLAVSPALERIVRHCLEKNAEERFQSARDIAFNLEALATLTSSSAAPPPAIRASRRPVHWAAAGVALLAVTFLAGRKTGFVAGEKSRAAPSYRQLTFRRGVISSARFAPDGQTIVYTAAWDGNPTEIYSTRREFPESRSLGLVRAGLTAMSSAGEMAVVVGGTQAGFPAPLGYGALARAPLAGGSPREILEGVSWADWSPDGKQLAVVHLAEGKIRLEFPIGKVLYETAGNVSYPRISPSGDRIAFFDHPIRADNRGSVAIVDLAGKKNTLSTGWAAETGLVWSRQNPDEIWFTATPKGGGLALHGVTTRGDQRLITQGPGGMVLEDISQDGRALIRRDNFRRAVFGLAPGASQERDLSWFDNSRGFDLSADGKLLLFEEESEVTGPNYAVCLRKTDGSPPVRLGEGTPRSLSPDGKWALATHPNTPGLFLLPTGAGDPKQVKTDPLQDFFGRASWFPDSKRIAFAAREPGGRRRCWAQNIVDGGQKPQPITSEEEIFACSISPDGKLVATFAPDGKAALVPLDGGSPRPVSGLMPGDIPIQWTSDGRSWYLARFERATASIYRFELATGQRKLWKQITVPDRAGLERIGNVVVTPDGSSYAYTYIRVLSDLYLVEGLK